MKHQSLKAIFLTLSLFLTQCSGPQVPVTGVAKSVKPYCIKGTCYKPQKHYNYSEKGLASWYGPNFHGKKNAAGFTYNQHHYTAAHRTLPLPTIVRVTNLETNQSIILLVSDRGPYNSTIHRGCQKTYKKRIIDLSYAAAKELGAIKKGVIPVHVESLPQESQEFANVIKDLQEKTGRKKVHFVKAFHRLYA